MQTLDLIGRMLGAAHLYLEGEAVHETYESTSEMVVPAGYRF